MDLKYDVTIIGSGPGGYVAAIRSAQLGHKTAIIEKDKLGGICLNWGCIPTKALLKSSEVYSTMKKSDYYGVTAENVSFNFKNIIDRSRGVAKDLSQGIGYLLKKNKIDLITGNGYILDNNTIKIQSDKKETIYQQIILLFQLVHAQKNYLVLALAKMFGLINKQWLPVKMPKSIVVIGSGAIGIEFANFYNAIGVKVNVVELAERILPNEDEEVSEYAKTEFEKQGIKFHLGSYVDSITKSRDNLNIELIHNINKKRSKLNTDKVIMAVGITGNIENIGLEHNSINISDGHIITNEFMQTNVKNIYAIGDVAGAPWLAHKASHEGIIAAEHISGIHTHAIEKANIPGCVYSSPQIASIGLSENEAKNKHSSVKVGKFPLIANGKAKAISNDTGFVKVIYESATGELLGAHMIGDGVTELIHGYAIAKNMEGTEEDIINTIFPHPTISESMHEAVLSAYDIPIHYK